MSRAKYIIEDTHSHTGALTGFDVFLTDRTPFCAVRYGDIPYEGKVLIKRTFEKEFGFYRRPIAPFKLKG